MMHFYSSGVCFSINAGHALLALRQPDKGPAQPEKAKEDLLAAEKAFDDDESDKNMFSKK